MNNPTSNSPNNNAPVQLGHYQLRDCIGRGGMGLVYRARDTRLERDVAIKCLRTELFEAHYIERFKREALLLAKLNHPNIVQIYDFIEAPEQVALVMELVDGQNLQTYLREHVVPIQQRLQWLVQISEGLAVAHDAGIIHRDLKTENILINKRGQAKITDLGIAKSQDFNVTLTDHVAGSYCSMSPEQAMGETITFKSDLFSLGILAYQLLCGAHPFGDTSNKLQTMQRIITHPPASPQQHNPDLPAEFIELLGQLLSKDPDRRPDNTHWVAAQFVKLKELAWQDDSLSDDTEALAIPLSANTKNVRTQDHPTFDTRFVAIDPASEARIWKKIKHYISTNKISISSAAISVLIVIGIIVWNLQPRPPKYVAVTMPTLTAEGMPTSQQELIKSVVYDAIEQSIIQLDDYYLIPRNEVAEVYGDNEAVYKATAADELITAEIKCKIESCTIMLSQLMQETAGKSRLIVNNTRNVDILTDNYLATFGVVQHEIGKIFTTEIISSHDSIDEADYEKFLKISMLYRRNGANAQMLSELESLNKDTKGLYATNTLFSDIALDLFHETKNVDHLKRLENSIQSASQNNSLPYLQARFYLKTAQQNYSAAEKIIEAIKNTSAGNLLIIYELSAYLSMAQRNYPTAISLYEKALKLKKTSHSLYYLSLAYWRSGDTTSAKRYVTESLSMSPTFSKAHNLFGIIALLNGNIEEAKTAFLASTVNNPNDALNLSNLGLCYLLLGDFEQAYSTFGKAEKIGKDNILFTLNKGDAKSLGGKIDEANAIYSSLINRVETGNQPLTHELNYIAQAYAHLGRYTEALETLQKSEKLSNDSFETSYTAALVHTLAGNQQSAIYSITNALKSGVNKVWFNFSWFDALCSRNDFILIMKEHGEPNRCAP